MAINFAQAPTAPTAIKAKPGVYKAKIVDVRVATSKKGSKYINVKYDLKDKNDKACGSMYDILSESDSSYILYKWGRLNQACNLGLSTSIELEDVSKLLPNKELIVDTKIKKDQDGNDTNYLEVNLFSDWIYDSLDNATERMGESEFVEVNEDDDESIPF